MDLASLRTSSSFGGLFQTVERGVQMVRSELLVRGEYEGKKERRLKLFPLWSHLFLFLVNFFFFMNA